MAFGGIHPFFLKKAAASGGLFLVTPCAGGANVLCEDTGSVEPSVDDVVIYGDDTYCGTVYSTGQSGTAAYDLDEVFSGNCTDCQSSLGGGGGL